tara:strand:- start:212 stop:532 length:321 start_codon:yes stop_codon:yes gene_type:complete
MLHGVGASKLVYFAKEKKMTEEVKNVEEQQPVQLQLQDIATMVQLIDLVSRRGGFEGPELEAVGGLRSRIVAFLNEAAKASGEGEVPAGDIPVDDVEEVDTDGSAD